MRTTRLLAILATVVTTAAWACDSGNGNATDNGVQDNGADVPVNTDVATDPGTPEDTGAKDPGTADNAKPDTNPVDHGTPDTTAADVPQTCPAVVSGATCGAIAACAIQCDAEGRAAECVGATTGAEVEKWDALKACLATAACPKVWENEQFTACATTACKATLEACFVTDGGKCRDIWICRKDCDPDDPSCPARCYGIGSVEAQATWVTYKDCILGIDCAETDIMANGWPVWTCEEYGENHNCPLQSQACFPPST
jgi:hypothetical protein